MSTSTNPERAQRISGQSSTAEFRKHTGSDEELIRTLHKLDGRSYPAYKSVVGMWDFGSFSLSIDRIQADPYAPPSKVRAISTPQEMGLPQAAIASPDARAACADYLLRAFNRSLRERRLHDIQVMSPSVEILDRSACTVKPDRVELRFEVRMPARGRTILGHRAAQIFDLDVPDAVQDTFDYLSDIPEVEREREGLLRHIAVYEDYRALQQILIDRGWVSFIANGSVLARRSGVSQSPMEGALPFTSPATLEAEVELPHAGVLRGMAIEPGVTVIVGGGYHGKSTLLGAIQRGVYAHIPGDG
ncbi:MAG: isopentenyl-diphosphate delta-isomerase, partial [Actinomyces sp.]|nr:isopentenyl-diphosphate delta-isomerase [Actinomyces sp.]